MLGPEANDSIKNFSCDSKDWNCSQKLYGKEFAENSKKVGSSYLENNSFSFWFWCFIENGFHDIKEFLSAQYAGFILVKIIDKVIQKEISAYKNENKNKEKHINLLFISFQNVLFIHRLCFICIHRKEDRTRYIIV